MALTTSPRRVTRFLAALLLPALSAAPVPAVAETPTPVVGGTRLRLTGAIQNYLIDQAYVVPIFEEPQVFAGAPYVKGVAFEAVGRPSVYAAWLAKHG